MYRLGRVDKDDLGVAERLNLDHSLVGDGCAVARIDPHPVDLDLAFRRNEIAVASFPQRVLRRLTGLQRGAKHARLGADRQSIGIAFEAAGQHHKGAAAVTPREGLGAPRRRAALALRLDPNLEEAGGLRLPIVFSVADAASGAHHLYVASLGAPPVA